MRTKRYGFGLVAAMALSLSAWPVQAQTPLGTEITYQGQLKLSGSPLNGTADFQFKLFNAATLGGQVGSTQSVNNITVVDGLITVQLDFGASAFNDDKRWLEVEVRSPAGGGGYTTLAPRQPLTAAPYALKTRGVDGHSLDAADGSPVDAVFVDNSGNVGIGTTVPASSLHVASPVPVLVLQDSDSTSNQVGIVSLRDSGGVERGWMGFGTQLNPHAHVWNSRPGGNTSLGAGNQERLTVTSTGNVGIGDTNPQERLTVSGAVAVDADAANTGTAANALRFGTDLSGEAIGSKRNAGGNQWGLDLYTDFVPRMSITNIGNVGIGTTAPASKLQVVGGDLTFESTTDFNRRILTAYSLAFHKDIDNDNFDANFNWYTNGGTIEQLRIEDGDEAAIVADGTVFSNGIDYAEGFKAIEQDLDAGDVVSLAIGQWEHCRRVTASYDHHIVGVVSTNPGFCTGMSFNAEDAADPDIKRQRDEARAKSNQLAETDRSAADEAAKQAQELTAMLAEKVKHIYRPVALAGRVPCKVDATYGTIKAGDRLTSSFTPGHAMKQTQAGPSIGIALEDWSSGRGKIIVLVQPGWYGAGAASGTDVTSTRSLDLAGLGGVAEAFRAKDQQIAGLNDRMAALEAVVRGMNGGVR